MFKTIFKCCHIITVAGVLCLACLSSALAMPQYAKQFKLSCTFCHSKVPNLNEFGTSFLKDNPTPPELKLPQTNENNMQSKGDEKLADNTDSGKTPTATENLVYSNNSGSKSILRVNPPAPTRVYRRISNDGTQIFTDNPSGDRLTQKLQKPGADTNKPVAARNDKRPIKQIKAQPPVSTKKPDITAKPRVSAVRYRSYEECMEKSLLSQSKPANADEAMRFFVEAEETCRQFSNSR